VDGALSLIDILRNDARSYNAWVILLDEHRQPNRGPHPASATCIELLDDGSIRTNFDYYMQGQFMKFLGRGAVRLASSDGSKTCRNVAFLGKDGITTLVVANDSLGQEKRTIVAGTKQFDIELLPKSVATLRWRS
jgi:glucosylceramidase